ncbi:histidine phosphatase family protein [Agrilactobacillus yilanensis]|uniref:Histidine phosphatase family protein n=1 Tax=Agrilactobacillus yilanensis TaxID=2485997 RepID=A0ABW4J4T9_9LACO|nr:histidine phosphatase family protein [Agrilactobacillus yilanensis]
MTIFYFVRHGETRINHEARFNGGNVDSPLTPQGILGAQRTGNLLKRVTFDQMVASSLPRAQRTARIILKRNLNCYPEELVLDHRLREIDLGDWDGQKIDSVLAHPQYQAYFKQPEKFDAQAIHAEDFQHLLARANAAITPYIQPEANKVLVVSHGSLLLFLIHQLTGGSIATVRKQKMLANSSVTVLQSTTTGPFETLGLNITADNIQQRPELAPLFS